MNIEHRITNIGAHVEATVSVILKRAVTFIGDSLFYVFYKSSYLRRRSAVRPMEPLITVAKE